MVMLGIKFYSATISEEWLLRHRFESEDGAPPFLALLPRDRLVRRAQGVKKQVKATLAHHLSFEIGIA